MTTQRFTINAEGNLLNSGNEVVGRLISVEMELTDDVQASSLHGWGEGEGKVVKVGTKPNTKGQNNTGAGASNNTDVCTVWAHYQTVVPNGKQYVLEEKRRQIIRNALKVRALSQVLRAVEGLAASPFHNGQNDRRKKYLGIQFALKGRSGEGNDERIDKMAELAGTHDPLVHIPSAGREMVQTRQRQVEDMLLHPGDSNRRARGERSVAYLREQFGLTAAVEDGRVVWTGVPS